MQRMRGLVLQVSAEGGRLASAHVRQLQGAGQEGVLRIVWQAGKSPLRTRVPHLPRHIEPGSMPTLQGHTPHASNPVHSSVGRLACTGLP